MILSALLVASYILGSVPFGLIICRALRGIDIRELGSGNIGATNVLRTVGKGPAAIVFVADVLKGLIPVVASRMLFPNASWIAILAGTLAILGHTFSLFLRFKGGKGAATGLGVIVGLDWRAACIGFGVWLIVLMLCRYVSLASISASASIPVLMWAFHLPLWYQLFGLLAASFVILKHRPNIVRLSRGTEPRFGDRVGTSEV